MRAELAVAQILAASAAGESLYPRLLAAIGESLGWDFGAWWEASDESGTLVCVETWRSGSLQDGDFDTLTRRTALALGVGLPGRVWATGAPAWIPDLREDPNFPRGAAAALAGLRSGFAFPVQSARIALGAIEMFCSRVHEPDEELLETMAILGSQLGQLIERGRAEREVRESNERRRAILEAALDCVITIDERGRVVEFNPAAERTFGYRSDEAIGTEMAELIVPPALRGRHRAGLSRLLATGEHRIIDRRLELTGMRSDGCEFPVELTVTRIDLPGPPLFTGYVRDITERKRAEAELRASRARIVDAGDEARRRLERDLHDGAQARLVNLGLALRLARAKLEQPREAGPLLDEAIEELAQTTSELREFARGIHPAVLTEGGLAPALRALAARSRVPVQLGELPQFRVPSSVEATVYFLVAEALTNATRYSGADRVEINIDAAHQRVRVEVRDDGRGGADPAVGSGLRGLADRVAALDGSFEVLSPTGVGTTLRAVIPSG
ncbi:MAG TPA: PAS domain S-box protein [Solirubrobacteraceae bacterium]|nr:PAS domain S-box protein [Solirubrobacteraceae bacterium]